MSLAEKVVDRCIRRFGTTDDYLAANWVLPRGIMLRGFKARDIEYENRLEHMDIEKCLPADFKKSSMGAIEYFMLKTGAIRVNSDWVHVDCANELDREQMDVIENNACSEEGCIWDVTKNGDAFASSDGEYDPNGLRTLLKAYRRCRA